MKGFVWGWTKGKKFRSGWRVGCEVTTKCPIVDEKGTTWMLESGVCVSVCVCLIHVLIHYFENSLALFIHFTVKRFPHIGGRRILQSRRAASIYVEVWSNPGAGGELFSPRGNDYVRKQRLSDGCFPDSPTIKSKQTNTEFRRDRTGFRNNTAF